MSLEEEFRQRFLLQGIATGPATVDQIDALETALGSRLPAAYRAYLRVRGMSPPACLIGSDCVLRDVVDNNEAAREVFDENGIAKPTEPFVTFLAHQGYYFEYFPIDGSDDPPVYSYHEGDRHVIPSGNRFSHWVSAIQGHRLT